jgi:hypothetical protein
MAVNLSSRFIRFPSSEWNPIRSAGYRQGEYVLRFQLFTQRCVSIREQAWYKITMPTKNAAAVALGRRGGQATARRRTPEERQAAAIKAIEARWAKRRKLVDEITAGTKALLRTVKRRERAIEGRARKATKRSPKK